MDEQLSVERKIALVGGGVVAGLILLLAIYLRVVQVIAVTTPPPPSWGAPFSGSLFALAPPMVTHVIWRGDRRAKVPMARRLQRAEVFGALLGLLSILSLLIFF